MASINELKRELARLKAQNRNTDRQRYLKKAIFHEKNRDVIRAGKRTGKFLHKARKGSAKFFSNIATELSKAPPQRQEIQKKHKFKRKHQGQRVVYVQQAPRRKRQRIMYITPQGGNRRPKIKRQKVRRERGYSDDYFAGDLFGGPSI
jgi:hypothetical protein